MEVNGLIYAIISAVFFGSAGIFIKQGYTQNLSPVELLILQYVIAIIIMLIICLIKYRENLKITVESVRRLAVLGTVGNTVMTVSLYSAMAYLDVAVATMLLYTYPAMVALFSFVFYNEKVSRAKIAAILGTFAGSLLVVNLWPGHLRSVSTIGIGFGILSAAAYSFMNIYANKIVDDVPPLVITFYSTIFSLLALLMLNLSFIPRLFTMPVETILNAGLLAVFCEIIPLSLLYAAIGHIGPVKTSIISTLEIPVAALTAFVIMGEKLNGIQYTGIVLVILSIMILKRDSEVPSASENP